MASSTKTNLAPQADNDSSRCPLCGEPNDCALCTTGAAKTQCWCVGQEFPARLLARIPESSKNRACICRSCVEAHQAQEHGGQSQVVFPDDYYFDKGGLMVFTKTYLLRRGYCCNNDCRHCPYQSPTP